MGVVVAMLLVLTVEMLTVEFEVTVLLFSIVVVPLTVIVVAVTFVGLTDGAAVVVLFVPSTSIAVSKIKLPRTSIRDFMVRIIVLKK